MIHFITGNKRKFEEVQSIVGKIDQLDIELAEIQELDPYAVIKHKLNEAQKDKSGEYMVEDSALYLDCLNSKLPGPFIKWFENALGNEGLAKLVADLGKNGAEAVTIIGYAKNPEECHFFEGRLRGIIVPPRGDKDFGFGPSFQPEGHSKTFGEMDREEKHAISMRGIAARKLKEFLEKQS